jgi:DNA-binding IclR family transcriptional regulator
MLERIFAALELHVAGADLGTLSAATGEPHQHVSMALNAAISEGILERWPFWPERVRATGLAAPAFLRELAELRHDALPLLERINQVSCWPATLHLLVPGAHAVVERIPWHGDREAIARERAHYAIPRPLTEGATALAILAHLPDATRATCAQRSALPDHAGSLARIRTQGYCLQRANHVAGGWVLSAALRAADGTPYGAVCTYGSADAPSPDFVEKSAGVMRRCAEALSQLRTHAALTQRARAIVEEMARRGE